MTDRIRERFIRLLRWSERYTKTDMVYLAQVGLWTNLNVIISSVLALVLSVAFANLLPKEVYGFYQYLLSLSAFLAAICMSGMMQAVVQSVARGNEGDVRVSLRVQLKWNFVPIGIALLGALYYALHDNTMVATGLVLIAFFTPLVSAFSIYSALLSGRREFRQVFIYSLALSVVYYAAMFIAMLFFKNAIILILVNLGVNALATIYLYFRTLKMYAPNDQIDPHTTSYGSHLSVMNAFSTVIAQLDSILVFHFLGPVQLAVYSFATFIPERIGGLFSFISTAAFPKFSQRSLGEIRHSIIPQTIRAALVGAVGTIAYVIFSPVLFYLLFPKYLDALRYTQFYALVILLMAANLVTSALLAQRRRKELYITSFVNPILLITLQVPLLLMYGIWGMLIARLISDFIGIILGLILLLRSRPDNSDIVKAL